LLEFEPLANAALDRVEEGLIESYVQMRSKSGLAPATINRQLATLRRALHLAYEWHVIDRLPRVHLLAGEHSREFVLSHAGEKKYLDAAPQPLRDIALLIMDGGLRTSEALKLEWQHVHLEPATGAKCGYIHVAGGKSKNAKRNVPLTKRLGKMLLARSISSKSVYVFPSDTGEPYLVTSIDHMHKKVRAGLQMGAEFVIYSLRHTYGTRLGEAGADAFTMMRLMGHSSVTVSQRYVHPTPEALQQAVSKLQALNLKVAKKLPRRQNRRLPATKSATVQVVMPVSY
jgi:integrase